MNWDPYNDKQCISEYCELHEGDFQDFIKYNTEVEYDHPQEFWEQWYCEINSLDFLEFANRYLESYLEAQSERERYEDR